MVKITYRFGNRIVSFTARSARERNEFIESLRKFDLPVLSEQLVLATGGVGIC